MEDQNSYNIYAPIGFTRLKSMITLKNIISYNENKELLDKINCIIENNLIIIDSDLDESCPNPYTQYTNKLSLTFIDSDSILYNFNKSLIGKNLDLNLLYMASDSNDKFTNSSLLKIFMITRFSRNNGRTTIESQAASFTNNKITKIGRMMHTIKSNKDRLKGDRNK